MILLQINVVSNLLSTGKIAEDISNKAIEYGWEVYTIYGRWSKPGVTHEIRVAPMINTYLHYLENRLFDNEGLSSRLVTKRLTKKIDEINPDIIHLHNIHDHYLNYPILFEYLSTISIPIVWTQHDCWSFTGGCGYFDLLHCDGWKSGCLSCPENRAIFCNKGAKQYVLKQKYFNMPRNLVYVSVSDWLGNLLKQSHQGHRPIITIHNGVDITRFRPTRKIRSDNRFCIIGVAAPWSIRKGLEDFVKLRSLLSEEYEITLVGLSESQIKTLPLGIRGIQRTSNINELVDLYSESDVFVNPTYEDNFPTVNIEALACGTPVITYNTGGSPEAIDSKTGIVIEQGNLIALANAIMYMKDNPLSSDDCRKRAEMYFDKDKCFEKYIELYENLIEGK